MAPQLTGWFTRQHLVAKLAIGCAGLLVVCCVCSVPVALMSPPPDDSTDLGRAQRPDPAPAGPITDAPVATATAVRIPTATSVVVPTATSVVVPTATSVPVPAATSVPVPTATSVPVPAATSVVVPTATSVVVPAATSVPVPAATSVPVPTATSVVVPTATSVVVPTATSVVAISGDRVVGTVSRVIDGDTIDVTVAGETVRVRLIGVDTPESVHPSKPVECYGLEASAFLRELAQGRTVSLEIDPSQDTIDRYGRWLRYVWLDDGTLVNGEIIARGYGFEYTFRTPHARRDEFRTAEAQARDTGTGMWAADACRAAIVGDTPAAEVPATAAPAAEAPATAAPAAEVPPSGSAGDCPGDAASATNAPIAIVGLDKRAETVTIRNVGDSTIALDGWWICSALAGQRHATLSGSLAPGAELVVASAAGKQIWNNSTSDPAVLYDPSERLVSFWND